ncbi:MAG: hypothetical protein KDD73_11145, partial [Anaerolineales bacterium]|nr:hypothetical protein [Anaerolineales bacterium]
MNRDALERLLDRVADGDAEARDDLLDLINRQSPGLRALAHEALEEGGPDMREQLIMTLAHDPELDMGGFRPKPVAPPADAAAEVEAAPPELLYKLSKGSKAERISAARELGNYADPSGCAADRGADLWRAAVGRGGGRVVTETRPLGSTSAGARDERGKRPIALARGA